MLNETSRFHLVIDVIDREPKLRTRAAHLKEEMSTRRGRRTRSLVW
jgi:xylulose-5-phosphate/fructose-6-phosphate phosphoketolase